MSQRDDDMVVDFAIGPEQAAAYYCTTPDDVLFEADVQVTAAIMDILAANDTPALTPVPPGVWERIHAVVQADDTSVAELPAEFVAGLAVAHTLQARRGPVTGALPVISGTGPMPVVVAGSPRAASPAPPPVATERHPEPPVEAPEVPVAVSSPPVRRLGVLTGACMVAGVALGLGLGLWGSKAVLSPMEYRSSELPTMDASLLPQSLPTAAGAQPLGNGVDLVAPGTNAVAGRVDTSTGDGHVQFRVTVKAIPPSGSYLEAWLLRPDGTARVSLGVLTPARPATLRAPATLLSSGLTVFDVSQEPLDAQPAFSGTSVARGVLVPSAATTPEP